MYCILTFCLSYNIHNYIKKENDLPAVFFLYYQKRLIGEFRLEELAIQTGDVGDIDALGALQFAGTGIRAVAETQLVHLGDHRLGTAVRLRTPLRKQGQGADARGDEEHRGTVLAGGDTSAATHAGGRIHAVLGPVVRNQEVVGILRSTRTDGNESACLEDLVECGTVHHQILDHRETGAAPGFHRDGGAVLEMTHKELAGRHVVVRPVGASVDIQSAGTADALAAVMVEGHGTAALAAALHCHGVATLADQLLIEDIEHLQERGVFLNAGNMIGLEMTFGLGVLLTPYLQIEFHLD